MKWKFTLDFGTSTSRQYADYSKVNFDDSKWAEIEIGQAWEDQGYDGYDEGAWYRVEIEVNAKDDKKPVYMAFGGVDKDAWVYVNGQLIGEHHIWDRPFILDVSEAVEYHGKNAIAIRVYDGMGMGMGMGGIYGLINLHQPNVPVDLGSR
jgi:beta-galactosidase/beta-glucuronidase